MKLQDGNHQKHTGEWCKHVRRDLKKVLIKRRRRYIMKLQEEQEQE